MGSKARFLNSKNKNKSSLGRKIRRKFFKRGGVEKLWDK
jgi:hypothetical protein